MLCASGDILQKERKNVWDYLEVHVYDQWSMELQEFIEAASRAED
ncbi:hypothetical protein [Acetivibrio ethanolgignens]|nr:hypothetical protein [Acetivibrio ethanolgignens]